MGALGLGGHKPRGGGGVGGKVVAHLKGWPQQTGMCVCVWSQQAGMCVCVVCRMDERGGWVGGWRLECEGGFGGVYAGWMTGAPPRCVRTHLSLHPCIVCNDAAGRA